MKQIKKLLFVTILLVFSAWAQKVKDISQVVGVRENQLIGYGLVVGLNGTGDGSSSIFTVQSLANMLESVNVKVDPAAIKSKNVAAVMVTAKLPPFARQGDKIDLLISSIGDAKSLEGGTLLMTPLKGVDGKIYAIGQGAISIGGRSSGAGGNRGGNHALAATIPNGGVIEKEVIYDIYNKQNAILSLKDANFENAISVQNSINKALNAEVAKAVDPRTIKLQKPEEISMVEFLATVLNVDVNYVKSEKIVIDERTGTIIAGVNITIEPVLISHGDITVKISPTNELPQGDNESGIRNIGEGVAMINAQGIINTTTQKPTVANIARALQKMGAEPKDIIAILTAMKKAGAINAELEVI